MSKSRKTSGLDQIGPAQYRVEWLLKHQPHRHSITARVLSSNRHRNVKITLSDHLFSSDEIKTKEDDT